MSKISIVSLGAFIFVTAWGDVRTWVGNGADSNWSTAANWDSAPVSDAGDTLIIPAGTSTVNDLTGLKIQALWFTGNDATTVRGNELTFSVAGTAKSYHNLSNDCPLSLELPIRVTKNFFGWYGASGVDYRQPVVVEGSCQFMFGAKDMPEARQGVCNFWSTITAPQGIVGPGQGHNASTKFKGVNFYGAVTAGELRTYGNYNNDYFLYSSANDIRVASVGFSHIKTCGVNALGALCVLKWSPSGIYVPNGDAHNYYDFNGNSQVIDRIGQPSYVNYGSLPLSEPKTYDVRSTNPMVLTMQATASDVCGAAIQGAVSVRYAPVVAGLTETFTNRHHQTTGTLSVSNGTIALVANTTFSNLTSIALEAAATCRLATTAPGCFFSLSRVTLRGASNFIVAPGVDSPFGVRLPELLILDSDSRLDLGEDGHLTVSRAIVNGAYVADGTYTAATASWLTSGTVVVSDDAVDTVHWRAGLDGLWSAGANWLGGAAPSGTQNASFEVTPGVYTAQVDVASFANRITVQSAQGTATLAVKDGSTFDFTGPGLSIGDGGQVAVPSGTTWLMNTPTTATSSDVVVDVANGGAFLVDGGLVDFTRGNMSDKGDGGFRGNFLVASADPTKISRLRITDGTFRYMSYWGGYDGSVGHPVTIGTNGRLEIAGTGTAEFRTGWWWNAPIILDGGEVEVSDHGILRLYGRSVDKATGVTHYLGRGTVVLRDQAQLTSSTNSESNIIGIPSRNSVEGWNCTVLFTNEARLAIGGTLEVGSQQFGAKATNRTKVTLASDATHTVGRSLVIGVNTGCGEVEITQGTLVVTNQDICLGGIDGASGSSANSVVDTLGTLRIAGGTVDLQAKWAGGATSATYGFLVGAGTFYMKGNKYKSFKVRGRAEISSGALINRSGAFLVGQGLGSGEVVQTGGSVESGSNLPFAIGAMGGTGAYYLTNGLVKAYGDVYVGGFHTNNIFTALQAFYGTVNGEFIDVAASETAQGLLEIHGAGTMRIDRNLIVSDAGMGTLSFVLAPEGAHTLTVGGVLTIGTGSKLKVDARKYTGQKSRIALIQATQATGSFTDIELEAGSPIDRIEQYGGGVYFVRPRGTMVIFR